MRGNHTVHKKAGGRYARILGVRLNGSETFPVFPGRSFCGRLLPLPVSSINGIRGELKGRLPPVFGPLEGNYRIIK